MKWFRFYSEAVNDPKVQRLPGELFKFWVNLLCIANNADERGQLPQSADDIAWALRLDIDTCKSYLHTLQGQGLLDWQDDDDCYQPHNWDERQKPSDDSTARVQKHREKSNVSEPPIYKEDETLQKRYSNALDKNRIEENREDKIDTAAPQNAAAAQPPEEKKDKYDWALLWDLVATDLGYKPSWNYGIETKSVKRILAAHPDTHPEELVAFLAYKRTCFRADPNGAVTFTKHVQDFAAWLNAGKPKAHNGNGNGNGRGQAPQPTLILNGEKPPHGYSWAKDERGNFKKLGRDPNTMLLPWGGDDVTDDDVREKEAQRAYERTKRPPPRLDAGRASA